MRLFDSEPSMARDENRGVGGVEWRSGIVSTLGRDGGAGEWNIFFERVNESLLTGLSPPNPREKWG